jgi:hypothetical protein
MASRPIVFKAARNKELPDGEGLNIGSGVLLITGTGSPEGVVTAPVSSEFHRTDGGANSSVYRKESGAGNTGWVPVSNAGGGGSVAFSTVDINFGAGWAFGKSGTFAHAGAVAGESVLMAAAPLGDLDEGEMDGLICRAAVISNDLISYSIMAVPGPVTGTYRFKYIKG